VLRNQADTDYLEGIRTRTLAALTSALNGATEVAIVDAPNQRNVGDSLIWAGELEYLRKLGIRIRYVADLWTYDPHALRRLMPDGVILLHGGGNFGDLWVGHQILREMVARDLPDYPVVQLPQSIFFQDASRAVEANTAIGSHPDFKVMVRDHQSEAVAGLHLPNVAIEYCPDMALGCEPVRIPRQSANRGTALAIARKDKESSSGLSAVPRDWIPGVELTVADWKPRGYTGLRWRLARVVSRMYRLYARARRKMPRLPVGLVDRVGFAAVRSINEWNISGALRLYSRSDIIVVDRLHAHILAGLVGIPHVVLDNNYGKVSGIFREYSGALSTAHYVDSLPEARSVASDIARNS
jgi:pyruvyl transferase EpsO